MNSLITKGIHITVESEYQEQFSNPLLQEYVFAYDIIIENHSDTPVKLLSRHWTIFDSSGQYTEVVGEGVVGQQPMIMPGESFNYSSACNLRSDMGRMKGSYVMQNQDSMHQFEVMIPGFDLIASFKNN